MTERFDSELKGKLLLNYFIAFLKTLLESESAVRSSRGVDEPGAAFNPTDKQRAFLKATLGHPDS